MVCSTKTYLVNALGFFGKAVLSIPGKVCVYNFLDLSYLLIGQLF